MKLKIVNGRMIDPASGFDGRMDILVENGIISKIGASLTDNADRVIDATGSLVLPGLVDIHVHFRQPGREDIETIDGGARIAARSGYTTVCVMPNTNPPPDNPGTIDFIREEAEKAAINVLPVATVTKGRKGDELVEMKILREAGAVAFSDDGGPVANEDIMRRALETVKELGVPILAHEEDLSLARNGCMHEGNVSVSLGLQGIPRAAEENMITRDIHLSSITGAHLHVQHISSGGSVALIRNAKKKGIHVTCETAPHYFALTDEVVRILGANAKMNPPVREETDRREIIEGLRDGTIDVIATDHAPHLPEDKARGMEKASFGIIGLETAVPLIITRLIREERFSYVDAFSKVTSNPCSIIGIDRGRLAEGKIADIVIIDPDRKVSINETFIHSRCKNTPFTGIDLYGSVVWTIRSGTVIHSPNSN
jgi:dihydroorotase